MIHVIRISSSHGLFTNKNLPCCMAEIPEYAASDDGGSADESASVESVIWYRSSNGSSGSTEDGVDDEQEPDAAVDSIPGGTAFNLRIHDQDACETCARHALCAETSEGV